MNSKNILKYAVLGTAVASIPVSLYGAEAKEKASPNFVFILADDMGWTGLSAKMHDKIDGSKSDFYKTPYLDSLAAHGMRFSCAYSPSAMCTPSRASFLTGKSPAKLHMTTPGPSRRVITNRKVIPPKHIDQFPAAEITIAEILKKKGYASAYFGKWHLSGGGPGKHGFDKHDGETGNKSADKVSDSNPKDIFGITERANAFMEKQVKKGKPFYVQLSHYALHKPVQALAETEKEFSRLPAGKYHKDVDYAAMTKDLDTSVGMLMKKINALGISGNTYVIFMSDNGAGSPRSPKENFPLSGGKATLMEGGIRVPLIIKGPGIKADTFCYDNVTGCDLFPTFCELAGIKTMPDGVEGTSLVPLLHGKEKEFKRNRKELIFHFPHYGRGPVQVPQSAIILDNMKLIKYYETDEIKLFDLARDISEKNDLSKLTPEIAKKLEAKMNAYLKEINAQFPTKNPDYDPSTEEKSAQEKRKGNKSNDQSSRFIKRFDKDGDGKVSKKEFKGPSKRFGRFDKDGDGFISVDESPTGPPRGR